MENAILSIEELGLALLKPNSRKARTGIARAIDDVAVLHVAEF